MSGAAPVVAFVILANRWDAVRDNPTSKHQIAMELLRRGHRVLWVEAAGMRVPSLFSFSDWRKMGRALLRRVETPRDAGAEGWPAGNLTVVAPLLVPLPGIGFVREWNAAKVWGIIKAEGRGQRASAFAEATAGREIRGEERKREQTEDLELRNSGTTHSIMRQPTTDNMPNGPILINYSPLMAGVMRRWAQECDGAAIYHCVDRWDAFGSYSPGVMRALDGESCAAADWVVASSQDLFERCRIYGRPVYLLTHGVNYRHFASVVSPESGHEPGTTPVAGFFGLLSSWVDQELLVRLSRSLQNGVIELMGRADVDIGKLAALRNIRLKGPVAYKALPERVSRFSVGLIPFVVNDLTRAVNPLKLREMLAAGCPIVSTALPEVKALAASLAGKIPEGSLRVAETGAEFVRFTREVMAKPLSFEERKALSCSMETESWSAKTDELLRLIEGGVSRKSAE